VYDIDSERRKLAEKEGLPSCQTIEEAVFELDCVVTCVPEDHHVEQILVEGVYPFASKGTYICDCSTISPESSKRFKRECKRKGFVYVDAPSSGSYIQAQNSTLTFMVGA